MHSSEWSGSRKTRVLPAGEFGLNLMLILCEGRGVAELGFGISNLEIGISNLEIGNWELELRIWKLGIGMWDLVCQWSVVVGKDIRLGRVV
jgi:hypothetical protein